MLFSRLARADDSGIAELFLRRYGCENPYRAGLTGIRRNYAFAPFALFPVWVIVVATILARRMRAINSQNPANN